MKMLRNYTIFVDIFVPFLLSVSQVNVRGTPSNRYSHHGKSNFRLIYLHTESAPFAGAYKERLAHVSTHRGRTIPPYRTRARRGRPRGTRGTSSARPGSSADAADGDILLSPRPRSFRPYAPAGAPVIDPRRAPRRRPMGWCVVREGRGDEIAITRRLERVISSSGARARGVRSRGKGKLRNGTKGAHVQKRGERKGNRNATRMCAMSLPILGTSFPSRHLGVHIF